ncbi:MAG: sugar ABC transporter ATP-binding protein [Gudongella sp.]|nr:sugar ABC transporter ATP-binding protein [Gudongella sp.]
MAEEKKQKKIILRSENLGKEFNGVWVLKDINFDLREGEIHSLVGENGAGKSTFIKILSGVYKASEGNLYVEDNPVNFESVHESEEVGIRTVHQEINLVPYFNAYENIFIGSEEVKKVFNLRILDDVKMKKKSKNAIKELGIKFDVGRSAQFLSTACQKVIEIAKVLVQNPKIIIFDEPTTALGEEERDNLLEIIKELKSKGYSIIYITHNLEEVMNISDRITVFRDGNKIDTVTKDDILKMEDIIPMMLGHKSYENFCRNCEPVDDVDRLEISKLYTKRLKNISFQVKKGEIVGIAGIVGAGKTEIAKALFGLDNILGGKIKINGVSYIPSPKEAIMRGIALVPEERKTEGIVPNFSVTKNTTLTYLNKWTQSGVINKEHELSVTKEYISKFDIKTTGPRQPIKYLSGGNQQKVIVSRWLLGDFDIGIFDEPTKGIDIKAKEDIYILLDELASKGKSIIFLSSYLPELINICNRILVINNGRIVDEFDPRTLNAKNEIMTAMMEGYKNAE